MKHELKLLEIADKTYQTSTVLRQLPSNMTFESLNLTLHVFMHNY